MSLRRNLYRELLGGSSKLNLLYFLFFRKCSLLEIETKIRYKGKTPRRILKEDEQIYSRISQCVRQAGLRLLSQINPRLLLHVAESSVTLGWCWNEHDVQGHDNASRGVLSYISVCINWPSNKLPTHSTTFCGVSVCRSTEYSIGFVNL
jgi:hypothetical protein